MRGFKGLLYEASERQYWATDDRRWGLDSTAWHGFWLLAFFGRIRDMVVPRRPEPVRYLHPDGSVRP